MRRLTPLPLLVAAAFAVPVAAAQATTYCVAKPACAAQAGNATAATLKAAIDAAAVNAGQDRIELGAGTFPYPGAIPAVTATNDIASITGVGEGATHVQAGPASAALVVDHAGTVVSDLTIDATPANNNSMFVLSAAGATARRVTVEGPADDGTGFAVSGGALLEHVTTKVPTAFSGMTSAYVYGAGGGSITDADFISTYGIRVNDADATVLRNVRVRARHEGVEIDQGTVDIDGLLLDAMAAGTGVDVRTATDADLTLRHATILKHGATTAISVVHTAGAGSAQLLARDVLIAGDDAGTDLYRAAAGGTATLDVGHSSYDPARVSGIAGLPGPTDIVVDDPGFVDAAAGQCQLRAGSPLVDRGEPALPAGGTATDLDGVARVTDGDGDGVARTDIGAFERPAAPVVPVTTGDGGGGDGAAAGGGGGGASGDSGVLGLSGAPGAGAGARIGHLTLRAVRQRLDRRGRITVLAACAAPGGCHGTLRITTRTGRRTVLLGTAKVALADGAQATLRVRVSRVARRALRGPKARKVTARATVRDGAGTVLPAAVGFAALPSKGPVDRR